MKKTIFSIIMFLFIVCLLASCEKEYHCTCSFDNNVVYTKDLGNQYKKNAENQCNSYDNTVKGETWNCTLY